MNNNEGYRSGENEEYAYKNVLEEHKNSRVWSAVSVGVGALSIILCFIPVVGILLGLCSVAFSVISRRMLGYFENLAVGGLVVGIFGIVFGIGYSVFEFLLENTSIFNGIF